MNPLRTHQALQAHTQRRAVPKASRRHIHCSSSPLVVAGYHLAGDPGAPVALLWGTNRHTEPHCIVVPEPRNRSLRFQALAEFGSELVSYLKTFRVRGIDGICLDAPQLIVPNTATADWLGGIVGRFTRNLRTNGDSPVPPVVPIAGKHLSFFTDRAPGSCLLVPATDALAMHWQTGQLPIEDLNLAALLGWIDPRPGMDGLQSARMGEAQPPAGPVSDPNWDANALAPLIGEWHRADNDAARSNVRLELASEIRTQLTPAWVDCWKTLDCLNSLPPANHVTNWWELDRRNWSAHCARITDGRAFFRNIPTPVQDAARLRIIESRTEDLARNMALDDPLVMAVAVASGEALAGRVIALDSERRTRNAHGRAVRRPLITVEPALEFTRPAGTTLFLSTNPGVKVEVLTPTSSGLIRIEVLKGANQNSSIRFLPKPGDDVVLSPYGKPEYYARTKIEEVPWTHQLAADEQLEELQ